MHVIDIGQGDAILLEFKKHAVLIDTGGEDTTDAGRYKGYLTRYLDDFFARRDDLDNTLFGVVLSHPHLDHAKYLLPVMDRYNFQTLIERGGTTHHVKSILTFARKKIRDEDKVLLAIRNNTLNSAAVLAWTDRIVNESNATVKFLSGRRYCSNENNDSVVMRIEFG
jgi:beta-lactamase superfamily II metal-dependent hydrolase